MTKKEFLEKHGYSTDMSNDLDSMLTSKEKEEKPIGIEGGIMILIAITLIPVCYMLPYFMIGPTAAVIGWIFSKQLNERK